MDRQSKSPREVVDELLAKAIPNGECLDCHLAATFEHGKFRQYVMVGGRNGKRIRASRLVYEQKVGPIENDLWVLHKCDNQECINPKHLFLGTPQDNTDDMVNKGRARFVNPRTDHRWQKEIIDLHKKGLSRFEIAKRLNVSPSTVWNYVSPRGPYYVSE